MNFIPTARLVDWVGAKGFHYKGESDRVRLYRQTGTVNRLVIKKSATVSKTYAASVLGQAGYNDEEIAARFASLPPPVGS